MPGHPQGVRGRLRQPRSGHRHRAPGGAGRDPGAGRGRAGDDPAGRSRSVAVDLLGTPADGGGPGAAARRAEDLQRQDPALVGARALRVGADRPRRRALGLADRPAGRLGRCGRRSPAASARLGELLYAAWAYGSRGPARAAALARRRPDAGPEAPAAAGARHRPLPVRLDRHAPPPGGAREPEDRRAADRGAPTTRAIWTRSC